ncbi:dedicated sortase system histidine kinase [Alteromonadaceae bacterium Bs31]|nr:dedicated sortase system histidine kinase [Alteromonadaceae bacterium Bs31]
MKLRKQLLVVSLITLTLPWVGCQYIREMDNALRKGQTESLTATAKAVSARLGSDPQLLSTLTRMNPPLGSAPVFVHPLSTAPITDGYADDLLSKEFSLQALRTNGGSMKAQLFAGSEASSIDQADASLYLFLRVTDKQRRYFIPTLSSPLESDHLLLQLERNGQKNALIVYSTGPGDFKAGWLSAEGNVNREYRVSGHSSEWHSGYQVEILLPLGWALPGLAISVIDEFEGSPSTASNIGPSYELPPLIFRSKSLSRELDVFQRKGVRLQLATRGGRPIADSGKLISDESSVLEQRHNFINWFYRAALHKRNYPVLDESSLTGLVDTPELSRALSLKQGENGLLPQGWYQQGQRRLARVAVPIYDLSKPGSSAVAALIADQSEDSLATLTSSAFYRLLFYSLFVTFAASATLIIYASWLSFRLRRLSRAAATALSDNGKIAEDFPVSKSNDEIGDLSRNYAILLTRLREYTNYLRSLSSKLSHELRTPLAIVKSSLENLEHEKLSKKAKTYADRAKEGTSRLSNILNAMSAASRVEQAISAAELESIPCDELLSNLKDAYEDVYKQARFKLNIRRHEGPLTLLGSGELLVQMFDKLVDNAADFCPEGGRIELGLYRRQDKLVFTVHNEGPPLPKHMHGQLFDSMVSVRDKPPGPESGQHLGLGLYIVRLIADFHRGEVQCYNVPDNSGVIFEIRLPAT